MMIAAMFTMVHTSLFTLITYTIPGKTARKVDITKEQDVIEVETLQQLATDRINHHLPFILAVVITGSLTNPFFHFFDAASILSLYKQHSGYNQGSGLPVATYNMTNPTNRQPIIRVYFFTLNNLTDTQFKYLCSDQEVFLRQGANATIYQQLLDAYKANNKAKFDQQMKSLTPQATPSSSEKRIVIHSPAGSSMERVNIARTYDPVTKQQLQVLMNRKTAKGMPYILAVAMTVDSNGHPTYSFYDSASIAQMYRQKPGRSGPYLKMLDVSNNQPIAMVLYYTLNKLSDPELHLLCSERDILTKDYPSARLYQAVFDAYNSDNKAAYDAAFAKLPKHEHDD